MTSYLYKALRKIEDLLIIAPWTERENEITSIVSEALNLANGEAAERDDPQCPECGFVGMDAGICPTCGHRGYYCPEHKYNPPSRSGLCFCPQCELEAMKDE